MLEQAAVSGEGGKRLRWVVCGGEALQPNEKTL